MALFTDREHVFSPLAIEWILDAVFSRIEHIIRIWISIVNFYLTNRVYIGLYEQNRLVLYNIVGYNNSKMSPNTNSKHARAIGEKLRRVRKEQQMSLRELAQKVEMSASMLSQIETGKAYPSVRSIYNIAAALRVPVDYFFPEVEADLAAAPDPQLNGQQEMTASEMREANLNRVIDLDPASFITRAQPSPVVSRGARPTIELKGGVKWSRLTARAEPGAEFLEVVYAPGSTSGVNMSQHDGREFGLVLEGELVVELGFEVYSLMPGDSIIFDSTTPHRLVNRGDQPMRALWVVLNQH